MGHQETAAAQESLVLEKGVPGEIIPAKRINCSSFWLVYFHAIFGQ